MRHVVILVVATAVCTLAVGNETEAALECDQKWDEQLAACSQTATDGVDAMTKWCSGDCFAKLINVTSFCHHVCADSSSVPQHILQYQIEYKTNATYKLHNCNRCNRAMSDVTTSCPALPSSSLPSNPKASYCDDAECAMALQTVLYFCDPETVDSIDDAAYFTNVLAYRAPKHGTYQSTPQRTSSQFYTDEAKLALAYCAPTVSGALSDILADTLALKTAWYEAAHGFWAGIRSSTTIEAATQIGQTPSTYIMVNCPNFPVDFRGTTYPDKTSCEQACNAIPRCENNTHHQATGGCFSEGTWEDPLNPNDKSCSDLCESCPDECSNCGTITFNDAGAGTACPNGKDDYAQDCWVRANSCNGGSPSYETQCEKQDCEPGVGDGLRIPPLPGSAFSSSMEFQKTAWPGGTTPADWMKKAFLKELSPIYSSDTFGGNPSSENRNSVEKNPLGSNYLFMLPNNSGTVYIGPHVYEIVAYRPLNTGFFTLNGSALLQAAIVGVINQSPEDLLIAGGNVKIIGDVNYGPGAIKVHTRELVVLAAIDNYGPVEFKYGKNTYLLQANNKAGGTITLDDVTGSIYLCTNAGSISITNSIGTLESVTNNAGGAITVTDTTATLRAATNEAGATITANRGTFSFEGTAMDNAGTIVVGQSGGSATATTVSVAGGVNSGSISILSGAVDITLDKNDGTISAASGVTGTIRLGKASSVTSVTGSSSLVVSLFESTLYPSSPASPPAGPPGRPPAAPPMAPAAFLVSTSLTVAGTVDDFTPNVVTSMQGKVASELSVPQSSVSIKVEAASVKVTITVALQDELAARNVTSTLSEKLSSTEAASEFLSTSEYAVEVESIDAPPTVETPLPEEGSEEMYTEEGGLGGGAIAGIVIGVVAALTLVGGAVYHVNKKKAMGTTCVNQGDVNKGDDKETSTKEEETKAPDEAI